MSERKRNNLIAQAKSMTGRVTRSRAAPLSNPSTSSGFRTSPSIQKRPATQATGIATRRHRPHGVSSTDDLDSSYQPPAHYMKPILDQSVIATRLRQRSRRGEMPKPLINTEENLSSEGASSEGSEDSSASVYRKGHSAFPSLKSTLAPPKEIASKRTSPYLPNQWFLAQCSKPTEVYIDGASVHYRKGEPEGSVGVWFGSKDP